MHPLELQPRRETRVARCTGGDVVVVVRVGKVGCVEQVFDIELNLEALRDIEEQGRIDAGIAGQSCRGRGRPDGSELGRLPDHTNASANLRGDINAVPNGKLMFGHLRQVDKFIAPQLCVLEGVASADLPMTCDPARHAEFDAFGACFTNVNGGGRVGRIGRCCVGAIKLEERQRGRQSGADIPFCAQFNIGEFLWREILLNC